MDGKAARSDSCRFSLQNHKESMKNEPQASRTESFMVE